MEKFKLPELSQQQVKVLPSEIDVHVHGRERNEKIKTSLISALGTNQLVMAQPFISEDMEDIYQLSPKLTNWLNDKINMQHFLPVQMLPKRLATFKNGIALASHYEQLKLPCVIKAASSSSGDGVYICLTKDDLVQSVQDLTLISGAIIVEEHIVASRNFGIHFGVPYNQTQPIDFLGVNEQLTTAEGQFIGGVISSTNVPDCLTDVIEAVRHDILPKIRSMGWYGVGCFDVLVDEQEKAFIIDCNFRMTGMSAYHFLITNGEIMTPLVGFYGEFTGNESDFENCLYPYAGKSDEQHMLQLITLSRHDNNWSFNAALFFDNGETLKQRARLLLDAKVRSQALEQLA